VRALIVPPGEVRAAIATAWLDGGAWDEPIALGEIVLRPHQRRAVARIRIAFARHRGALLADAVGMGKTFVALALAREAARPLVIAPAALRATWQQAGARCGTPVAFLSVESLGGARFVPPVAPDLLIVDEAHHARNPATARWRRLAALVVGARVLLLTATPIHNSARDLRALLALFLGSRVDRLGERALLRLVIRRDRHDLDADAGGAIPPIRRTRWRELRGDASVDRALQAIPPPAPTAGGSDGGALWRMGLARAWGSSDAALRAALRHRLGVATAIQAALEAGRHPTRRELRAWTVEEDAVQLAMPLFMADAAVGADAVRLARVVRQHAEGVRATLDALARAPDRDARRAAWLRAVRRRHAGRKIVAFTHSAATANALYRRIATDGAVAVLTGRGGRLASGPLSRAELLTRFAPLACGVAAPRTAERIDLLIASDCLSEGLDLRDASVVVHLDVPWTPARLAQRVGRAARMGAPHAEIMVHGMAPPTAVRRRLRLARRLRRKARAARAALGRGALDSTATDGERAVWLGRVLERWAERRVAGQAAHGDRVPVAIVRARTAGYIVAVRDGGSVRLLAGTGRGASDALDRVTRAVRRARRTNVNVCCHEDRAAQLLRRVARDVRRWSADRLASSLAALDADAGGSLVRLAASRLDAAVRGTPPHARPAVAALAATVRASLGRPLPAAVESTVHALLAEGTLGESWLRALAAAVEPVPSSSAPELSGRPEIVGAVIFVPDAGAA
jgi:superfamily II DNA or RNA helicase